MTIPTSGASRLDEWIVLFDWNGTLVDDTDRALSATNTMLARRGIEPLLMSAFTARFRLPLSAFFESLGVDDLPDAERDWNDEMRVLEPRARAGAAELLAELRAAGATVGVVSAAAIDAVSHDLDHLGLAAAVDLVCGDATDKAELLRQLRSRSSAYVGDTDYDVVAARSAGYVAVAIAHGYQDRDLVLSASPDVVLENLLDLPDQLARRMTAPDSTRRSPTR